jgi:hypothetical protein
VSQKSNHSCHEKVKQYATLPFKFRQRRDFRKFMDFRKYHGGRQVHNARLAGSDICNYGKKSLEVS